jgi:cell division protein FtsB
MKRILSLAVIATVTMMPAAHAAVSDEDFQQLREQLAAVSARLEQLAAENAELKAAQQESAATLSTVQEAVVEVSAAESPAQGETWADREG